VFSLSRKKKKRGENEKCQFRQIAFIHIYVSFPRQPINGVQRGHKSVNKLRLLSSGRHNTKFVRHAAVTTAAHG
jgi:hypothetical protein